MQFLHSFTVPDAKERLWAYLTSSNNRASRVKSQAMDVIVVAHVKLLCIFIGIQNNPDSSRMVYQLPICCVPQIIPDVVASVAVHVFEVDRRVWCGSVTSGRFVSCWHRVFNDSYPGFDGHKLVTFFGLLVKLTRWFEVDSIFHSIVLVIV